MACLKGVDEVAELIVEKALRHADRRVPYSRMALIASSGDHEPTSWVIRSSAEPNPNREIERLTS
jgi:hypothetical protein